MKKKSRKSGETIGWNVIKIRNGEKKLVLNLKQCSFYVSWVKQKINQIEIINHTSNGLMKAVRQNAINIV